MGEGIWVKEKLKVFNNKTCSIIKLEDDVSLLYNLFR